MQKGIEMEDSIDFLFIKPQQKLIEALVYSARAQGFHAGVRPYTGEQAELEEGNEEYPPVTRVVFIEYPEKTIEWEYAEVQADFLDSFPQYDK